MNAASLSPARLAANPLRTRADVQRLVRGLAHPLLPHFSPGGAQVRLGENRAQYGDPAGWLEGFTRPLWGLLPLAAGGGEFAHWPLWQRGLASGTDPAHPEYWGEARDRDQRSVEQAGFGFGLALAPEIMWEPLAPAVRARLAAWLGRINEVRLVDNNWLFFRVLVQLGLRRCGQAWSQAQIDTDLTRLDTFYLRDGWYSDGSNVPPSHDGRMGDYYVPMAFHLYGLIYARFARDFDPARAALLTERARLFAQDFQHWFSADGSAIPFGRSLMYRFAQGSFWGALAFTDVEALPWPVVKGLYLRHLRWWLRQPIFSETGLLTIGYAYPNLLMAENYNSPGSPYWAMKMFLPLALPAEHPFWQAEEAALPPRPAVRTVPGANLILTTDPRTGEATALNPGQPLLDWPRHGAAKYSKCAYSTRFAFSVPAAASPAFEAGLDTGIALSDDGRFFRPRDRCLDAAVRDGAAYSRWEPWPGVELRTWLLAEATGHLRVHRLRTDRALWSYEGGFAVPFTVRSTLQTQDGPAPTVRSADSASILLSLLGERAGECVDLGANCHLLASLAAMPVLRGVHAPGEHWLACWAGGSADPADDFAVGQGFAVEAEADGCRVRRGREGWWAWREGEEVLGRMRDEG